VVYEYFTVISPYPVLKLYRISEPSQLRLLLLNHIAVEKHRGIGRKEFLKTLAGNHIIWNNETGVVSGTGKTVRGYQGSTPIDIKPIKISDDTDNGDTYKIQSWYRFNYTSIFETLLTDAKYVDFHRLIVKSGLAIESEYRYSFVSQNQIYTILAPTADALNAISADTLTGKNLERFVKMHFIEGDMIFTDGKLPAGYYPTAYTIPAGNGLAARKAKVYIQPGIDLINIKAKNNSNFATVNESEYTNRICARSLSTASSMYPNIISTGVVHQIDKALEFDLVDIE
jgi:uncharacterized surface protein with fasciclin (FAS1) repeats